jgi:hypothetical protein
MIVNDANELVSALAWRNCPSVLIHDIGWKLRAEWKMLVNS